MTTFNITEVYTSKYAGGKDTKYTPMVGEWYRLTAEFDVVGTPKAPYPVDFHMADRWATVEMSDLTPGHKRVSQSFFLPLDGPIPWDVDVDPYHYADGVDPVKSPIPHTFPDIYGGGTSQKVRIGRSAFALTKAARKGTFEPAPPPTSIDYYDARTALANQSLEVTFPTGPNVERMVLMFGRPSSDGWQTVESATCSVQWGAGSATLTQRGVDNPSHYPVYFWDHASLPPKALSATATYGLTLRNVRVDRAKLRSVTWKQLDDARKAQPFAFYASPEAVIESNDAKVAAFVHDTLGTGYRQEMTPYDAARKLFQAVLGHITYYYPQPGQPDLRPTTAKGMLEKGFGDCGGFSILLVALFRNIGFAARTTCGAWTGLDAGHCWCELWFPGHGWVVCDGSVGNGASESGEFAYYFGIIPDLNLRFAPMRGNTFDVGDVETSWLQGPYEHAFGETHEKSVSGHTLVLEHLHLKVGGGTARFVSLDVVGDVVQLAAHRCRCAEHGGFRSPRQLRVRQPLRPLEPSPR